MTTTEQLLKCKQEIHRVETGDRVPVSAEGHASTVSVTATRPGYMLIDRYRVTHVSLEELAEADAARKDTTKVPTPEREPEALPPMEMPPDAVYQCSCTGADLKRYSKQRWWKWTEEMSKARKEGRVEALKGDLWEKRHGAACVPIDWPLGWGDSGICQKCSQLIVVESREAE